MSCVRRYASRAFRAQILAGEEPHWLRAHPRVSYVRQAYLALPPWQCREELKELDWYRRAWSAVMGREYVFDHVIPLNHPHVCGLTVPWNLRIVPREVNAYKGGSWTEEQLTLRI